MRDREHEDLSNDAPSLISQLGTIADDGSDNDSDDEEEAKEEQESDLETVSISISLLSTKISQTITGNSLSLEEKKVLKTFIPDLEYISQHGPKELSQQVRTLSLLLKELGSEWYLNVSSSTEESLTESQNNYKLALANLKDNLIPVRAHGLHILRMLIVARDPVIDVKSVTKIYLSTLKDDDSFIYLNSIKGLQALTDIHGYKAIKYLVDQYKSSSKLISLDEKLRIGEALQRTVQRLGKSLSGQTAEEILQSMISITSNRHQDVRLRASALSILGMACEVNPLGIQPYVGICLDCSIAILTFDKGDDKSVLRRAAVVLIASLLTGGGSLNDFPKEYVKDVLRNIRYINATDQDALVRVQSGEILEMISEIISTELSQGL